jgi:hypothetical protein
MTRRTIAGLTLLTMGCLMLCVTPLIAQDNQTYLQHAERFAISPPLRDLAKIPQAPVYGFHLANPVRPTNNKRPVSGPVVDPVEQSSSSAPAASYTVGADFLGVGHGFPNYTVPDAPPDTTMAVGDTQVVQWVNVSYTVCQKTSPFTCGPAIEGNTLWSALGGVCANNNDGDIIAQWDVVAHRWMLTQNVFASPYKVCVAISTTNDANGTYFLYQFPVVNNGFPDYPKWGIWTNNYAESWNNFGPGGGGFVGPVLCAYNRTKLLAGDQSAEQICHQYSGQEDSLLPADRDSITAPPSGEDQFAIGSLGDVDTTHVSLYSVHINNVNDWSQGAVFTGDGNSQLLTIANYNPACNGGFGGACVPQKGITDKVDSLGNRMMYRFAYWQDQPTATVRATPPLPALAQHWFVNWDVTASGGQMGVRWMEITAPIRVVTPTSNSIIVFQQGTYAPDGVWRWMGSIARDKAGDILLGYSKSCGDTCPGGTPTFPSIAIAGRQVNDPVGIGNLESEVSVVDGTGSQPATANRWGDYSAMRIDTTDGMNGCTFWYTTEYYQVTATFSWSTQVASAKFSNCN